MIVQIGDVCFPQSKGERGDLGSAETIIIGSNPKIVAKMGGVSGSC